MPWPAMVLEGKQHIKPVPAPDTPREAVKMLMFLLRIPEKTTDLTFVAHLPEARCTPQSLDSLQKIFQRFVATFRINDLSLFIS